jgi:hypothetical protein
MIDGIYRRTYPLEATFNRGICGPQWTTTRAVARRVAGADPYTSAPAALPARHRGKRGSSVAQCHDRQTGIPVVIDH